MTNEQLINTVNRIRLRSIIYKNPAVETPQIGLIDFDDSTIENAIIGSFLENFKEAQALFEFLITDTFYTFENQLILKIMIHLFSESEAINYSTVTQQLERNKNLAILLGEGGTLYLKFLKNNALSEAQIEFINSKIGNNCLIYANEN